MFYIERKLSAPIDDPSGRRFQIESASFFVYLNSYNIIGGHPFWFKYYPW